MESKAIADQLFCLRNQFSPLWAVKPAKTLLQFLKANMGGHLELATNGIIKNNVLPEVTAIALSGTFQMIQNDLNVLALRSCDRAVNRVNELIIREFSHVSLQSQMLNSDPCRAMCGIHPRRCKHQT